MAMSELSFEKYAQLILHLVAVEKEDFVLIHCDFDHKPLITQLIKYAYQKGVHHVQVLISSERIDGIRAEFSEEEYLSYFPKSMVELYREYTDKRACVISIRSPDDPQYNANVSASKLATINNIKRKSLSFFHEAGVSDQFSWIVVGYPSEGWAKNVFPELNAQEGVEKLWATMQEILRLNQENPIQAWSNNQEKILFRRKYMNEKKYSALRFEAYQTDFKVVLHERSTWLGAAHLSENGKYFQANLPTEELYTSPDCRYTEGHVTITRPLPIFGKKVEGITMSFREGKVIEAFAKVGNDILQQYLNADPRNRYLGEIALVDINSPVWQSKLVFNSILYDENAGVHFALGTAYTGGYGFKSSESTNARSLIEMGCNACAFHMDFVIGSEHISVYGVNADGKEEAIMKEGVFIEALK